MTVTLFSFKTLAKWSWFYVQRLPFTVSYIMWPWHKCSFKSTSWQDAARSFLESVQKRVDKGSWSISYSAAKVGRMASLKSACSHLLYILSMWLSDWLECWNWNAHEFKKDRMLQGLFLDKASKKEWTRAFDPFPTVFKVKVGRMGSLKSA